MLRAGGLKKWLLGVQHTQQQFRVIVTGAQSSWPSYEQTPYMCPLRFPWLLGTAEGTGLNTGRKAAVLSV